MAVYRVSYFEEESAISQLEQHGIIVKQSKVLKMVWLKTNLTVSELNCIVGVRSVEPYVANERKKKSALKTT